MSKHLGSLYQNLLHGKLPHNLSGSETVELVDHLGEVQPHGDDEFVFRVGNQRAFFKRPSTHDLGVEEVSRFRKFLQEAGSAEQIKEPAQTFCVTSIIGVPHIVARDFRTRSGS